MREFANTVQEFKLCNGSRLTLSQRVHYSLALFRRLRFLAGKRLTQHSSLSDRCNEPAKDVESASLGRDPHAVPGVVADLGGESRGRLVREVCGFPNEKLDSAVSPVPRTPESSGDRCHRSGSGARGRAVESRRTAAGPATLSR